MKKWIIIMLAILLSGVLFFICGTDEQNLGGNYYYLPLYEAIDVGYPGGSIIYKSPHKYLFHNIKVRGDVINVNKNKDFIIAIQNVHKSNVEAVSPINVLDSNSLNYFIIEKKTDLVYGPLSKVEYFKKRDELRIPKKLVIKDN